MIRESRTDLNCSIEVRAINKSIRVAYLLPFEETKHYHWIVDAVFQECYTRWTGGRTLIIPTYKDHFLHKEYIHWLEFYDPDFIYSYVDLEQKLIEEINSISSPIAFIKHKELVTDASKWQDVSPNWDRYFNAVTSLSTIHSLFTIVPRFPWITQKETTQTPTLITQYGEFDKHRFVPDNYGSQLDQNMYPNPIQGLYETFCFTPNDVPKRMYVGTNKTSSVTEIFSNIRQNKALPISQLAMAHSKSVPLVSSHIWARQFNLFIGNTCLDRIHFWNARNLCPEPGALLVSQEQLNDDDFLGEIGQFLNKHNFLGQHNGPAYVAIRSFTHSKEELSAIRERLIKKTFNSVILNDEYNLPAIATLDDIKNYHGVRTPDVTTFKLREDINELQAKKPEHFIFIPPGFQSLEHGQWMLELHIERHNNLSKYSNIIDTWLLPRRHSVVKAFTNNLARVSKDHRLTVLPSTEHSPLMTGSITNTLSYQLMLPDDENLFRWLILKDRHLSTEDLRSVLSFSAYENMVISDKGQNLRGVISMFDNHSQAAEFLSNCYWRNVMRSWQDKDDQSDADTMNELDHMRDRRQRNDQNKVYTMNKLDGFLPKDREIKEKMKNELRFDNIGDVNKYMKVNLTDTLEFLIKKRVFFRIHQWRCSYCGHTNMLAFEDMKESNSCSICSKIHFAPIDIEWNYELNNFIFQSLCEHNGLTVLWALDQIHSIGIGVSSFYYLPEVNLYPDYNNLKICNEIDILCVINGKFYAAEVKLSAINFTKTKDMIDKFIEEIKLIQPDIALLIFEQYCESESDIEKTKIDLKNVAEIISKSVGEYTKVETLVASDFSEFVNHPINLGYWGKRVNIFFDTIENKKVRQ